MYFEDGQGSGRKAGVDAENRLITASIVKTEFGHRVETHGDAYIWCFTGYDYAALDTVFFLRNDSPTLNLIVDEINLYGDTATKVNVHCPANPTAAGTAITGYNLNKTSNNVAVATAKQDETGNTQGTIFINKYIAANGTIELLDNAVVVLGYHDCIGVDLVTVGTMAYGSIIGRFV